MTLDEAIKHVEEVAEEHEKIKRIKAVTLEECKCAKEHRQLAEWLRELKQLKHLVEQMEKERWQIISVKQDPCDDAISRQALQEWIKDRSFGDIVVASEHNFDCLPPVTPQPKMGRWIDNHNNTISCDRCHTWFNKDGRYGYMHYCPNCGAKMQEVEE